METNQSSDTIDLSKSISRFIALLARNVLLISITLVVCIAFSLIYYWTAVKVYESKMIIQSDILSESYSFKLAENLNTHIKDSDIGFLASSLNLTNEEADQLLELKVASALSPMSQQMPERDKIIFVLTVRVNDNAILPKLQQGIIHYFSNNEYIKKRVDQNRTKCEGLIAALDKEIKMMDTLKNKILKGDFSISKNGGISLIDISGLYAVTADLHQKKSDWIVRLATIDSIQVIEGFTPYNKPVWPKLSISVLAGIILGMLAAFALLVSRSVNKKSVQ